MATRNVEMYSEKQYELEEIKGRIIGYFEQHQKDVADFRLAIQRNLGEARTMLLVFERHRHRSEDVSMVIQLSEFQNYQSADIFGTGAESLLGVPSWLEDFLVDFGIEALKSLGFAGKNI